MVVVARYLGNGDFRALLSKFRAGSYTDGVHRRGAASLWKYTRGLVIAC